MPKFQVKVSNNKLGARTAKLVRRIFLISGIPFAIGCLVLFLPIPNELIPVIFVRIPFFTVLLAIGITGFIIMSLIVQFGGGRYKKVTLDIKDDTLEIQRNKKSEKYQLSKLLFDRPEFETNKPEWKLTAEQEGLYIRFQSSSELRYFRKLIKPHRQSSKNESQQHM